MKTKTTTKEFIQNDWKEISQLLERIKDYIKENPDTIIIVSHTHKRKDKDAALKSVEFVHKTGDMKLKFSKKKLYLKAGKDGRMSFAVAPKTESVEVTALRKKQSFTTFLCRQKKRALPTKTVPPR